MDSDTIRRTFLSFFTEKGHTIVPSSSLIPVDPTLLLTVAGMVQFKPYLLGEEPPPYPTAATVQKSFRTEDIDIVGTTARHLTFFQMLGNFSFGDYFKERAIPLAYEFVTERLLLDPGLLWFTVHETDDEAAEIWADQVGVPTDRLQRGGRDNFWQMGVAGPCGPSSEIFFDLGADRGEGGGPIGGSQSRFVEIWNLVFMQNIQDEPYHVVGDLPAKNIDTGAGLERLAMVLQGVPTAFETDELRPVLATAEEATGVSYGTDERSDVSLRVLADHGRAISFLIADGVVPSNEGRGYVARRVLRRAVRHAWALGAEEVTSPLLIDATVAAMGNAYPELRERRDYIVEVAQREEARFRRTLQSGHGLLETALGHLPPGGEVAGSTAFKLHDTYGFPVELTRELAAERGHVVDEAGFAELMEAQRLRARLARGGSAVITAGDVYRRVADRYGLTDFLGYEDETARARVLAIVSDGEQITHAELGQDVEVFLDRTPFYAEAGGQVGDSGVIVGPSGTLRVADTSHALAGLQGHRARVTAGTVEVGQDVTATIDGDRRESIRKSHTGTHLLHWALRETLGDHARQAGSLVEPGRLRFDFSHHGAMTSDEIVEVERLTNTRVVENGAVSTVETTKEEALNMGALAFFGDKYGERVRVVKAGDYSTEFCGGTHVPTTGQIGPVVIAAESSIGANLRRVEALTGSAAYEHMLALRSQLRRASHTLRAPVDGVADAVEALVARSRDLEARLDTFEDRARSRLASEMAERAHEVGRSKLVVEPVPSMPTDGLRALALAVRERVAPGIVVLGTMRDGKGSVVAAVSAELVAAGVSAGALVADPASLMGGGGSKEKPTPAPAADDQADSSGRNRPENEAPSQGPRTKRCRHGKVAGSCCSSAAACTRERTWPTSWSDAPRPWARRYRCATPCRALCLPSSRRSSQRSALLAKTLHGAVCQAYVQPSVGDGDAVPDRSGVQFVLRQLCAVSRG